MMERNVKHSQITRPKKRAAARSDETMEATYDKQTRWDELK